MKTIYFIIASFFICNLNAQDINQFDAQGKRHGVWKKNFENTQVPRYEGEFKHGKEIGVFKFYKNISDKAVLTATRTFNAKNKIAEVVFYSSTKWIISKGKMLGKTYVGRWIYYHKNSKQVMTDEFYNNSGQLEGERKTYYLSGMIAEKANYTAGVLDGESIMYAESGTLIRILNYKKAKLDGISKSYDSKGKIIAEGLYQMNRKHGIWKFYKNGKLERTQDFTRRSKSPYKK